MISRLCTESPGLTRRMPLGRPGTVSAVAFTRFLKASVCIVRPLTPSVTAPSPWHLFDLVPQPSCRNSLLMLVNVGCSLGQVGGTSWQKPDTHTSPSAHSVAKMHCTGETCPIHAVS